MNAAAQIAPVPEARVDPNISDLFFNTDFDGTKLYDGPGGSFSGYDDVKMHEEAEVFLACLDRLGVATPTAAELIADFYGRI